MHKKILDIDTRTLDPSWAPLLRLVMLATPILFECAYLANKK